ncbi:hypothetical protein ACWIUD_11480 [Helicobacter sp. 23-1044]
MPPNFAESKKQNAIINFIKNREHSHNSQNLNNDGDFRFAKNDKK